VDLKDVASAVVRRGYYAHYMSTKHLRRYINEFSLADTMQFIAMMVTGWRISRLTYRRLTVPR